MRKGVEDRKRYEIVSGRRRRQTSGTVSVMENGKEVTVREGGEGSSRRLHIRKGIPNLKDSDVRNFVCV